MTTNEILSHVIRYALARNFGPGNKIFFGGEYEDISVNTTEKVSPRAGSNPKHTDPIFRRLVVEYVKWYTRPGLDSETEKAADEHMRDIIRVCRPHYEEYHPYYWIQHPFTEEDISAMDNGQLFWEGDRCMDILADLAWAKYVETL